MNTDVMPPPQRAEVDMICDKCNSEILEGQDFFYNDETENITCENCIEE